MPICNPPSAIAGRRWGRLVLPVVAWAVPAGAQELRDVRFLLDAHVRPGAWTAVAATVAAGDATFDGDVEVTAGAAQFRVRAPVAGGGTRRVVVPVFLAPGLPAPQARLGGAGARTVEPAQAPVEVPADELVIGVDPALAEREGLALPERDGPVGARRATRWVSLSPDDLREAPELLDGMDGAVLAVAPAQGEGYRALDPHVAVWMGRGGGLFPDVAAARRQAAAGWMPRVRVADGIEPLANDLVPRRGWSPRRVREGWAALGAVLALGAASALLAGWKGLPRRAPVAVLAAGALAGTAVAASLVPARGVSVRAAAVRELLHAPGPAGGRVAEAVEGWVSVESVGATEVTLAWPDRTRIAAGAPDRSTLEALSVAPASVGVAPGGWSVRLALAPGERRLLRFTRHSLDVDDLDVRFIRQVAAPLQVGWDNGLEYALEDAVLAGPGFACGLGRIPAGAVGAAAIEPGAADWKSHASGVWPPGDSRRALAEWWEPRARGRTVLAGITGDVPVPLREEAGLDVSWAPTMTVAPVGDP